MKTMLQKKLREKLANNEGFTLLEILVVLTIMGFLIAMVGPRLAGVSNDAVGTICDTNQNRMVTYMASYFEKTSKFPINLTNLVNEIDDTAAAEVFQVPSVVDGDPENGQETLAAEFNDRNHLRIHYLNNAELAELKRIGVVRVLNYNGYDAYDNLDIKADYTADGTGSNDLALADPITSRSPAMEEIVLPSDTAVNRMAVAMVGMGITAAGAWDATDVERGWGEVDFLGRIVLGMGPENGLIQSGIIGNAAHCPGGIQDVDNVAYNDYNVVLPRLEATVARMDVNSDGTVTGTEVDLGAAADPTALAAIAYDDAPAADYVVADNDDNLRYREFDITEAQDSYQYSTQCPEGHMYPEDDGEFWAVDLGGDGNV